MLVLHFLSSPPSRSVTSDWDQEVPADRHLSWEHDTVYDPVGKNIRKSQVRIIPPLLFSMIDRNALYVQIVLIVTRCRTIDEKSPWVTMFTAFYYISQCH